MVTQLTRTWEAPSLVSTLAELAPQVAIETTRERDHDTRWDGDGPSPSRRGLKAYNTTVAVRAISGGKLIEAEAHLGGSWLRHGRQDPDVSGYFPQMLEEALHELRDQLPENDPMRAQVTAAAAHVREQMQLRYDIQMGDRN
jgi:hypothetical protein